MTTLVDTIRTHVWNETMAGGMLPGHPLDEATIAEKFGISRTPIREAAHHLCGEGLLCRSTRGFMLVKPSLRDLRELLEFAGELEAACARLAARRITDDEGTALRHALEACATAVAAADARSYEAANVQFHAVIHGAARNAALVAQLRNVDTRCNIYRKDRFNRSARRERSLADHRLICAAIIEREPSAAHDAMVKHAQGGGEDFAELVADISPALFS